jgi:tetratricopeptide (TPR) repeat protein
MLTAREEQRTDIDAMLAFAEALGDERRRYDALIALADYCLVTETPLATAPAQQACEIAQRLGDPIREAHALRRLAWHGNVSASSRHTDNLEQTKQLLDRAATLFAQAGLAGEAAACMIELTKWLWTPGQGAAELEVAEKAWALSREAGDLHLEAEALDRLASVCFRLKRQEKVLQTADRALALSEEASDPRQEADVFRALVWIYVYLRQYAKALSAAKRTLALRRTFGDRVGECHAHIALGVVYSLLNQAEEARGHFEHSLAIAEEIGLDAGITTAVHRLRDAYHVPQGTYEEWLALVDQQLDRARARGRPRLVEDLMQDKADVLIDIGQFERALSVVESLLQDLGKQERVGEAFWGNTLMMAGWCKAELGDHRRARQNLERALAIFEKSGALISVEGALLYLARLALLVGSRTALQEGLVSAERAVDLWRASTGLGTWAEPLLVLVHLRLALGKVDEAFAVSREMIAVSQGGILTVKEEQYFYTHAMTLRALGRKDEADRYLQRAHERVMLVANRMKDPALRRSWLENVRANRDIVALWEKASHA